MLTEGLSALIAGASGVQKYLIPGVKRSDGTTGVFPGFAPKEVTLPYIAYQQISGKQDRTMQGSGALQEASFQLSIYSSNYFDAKKLAQAVKALLAGYDGTLPDADATVVEGIWLDYEGDLIE